MSRAFVKEGDGTDAVDAVPERPISPLRNLVTARGLARIEAEIAAMRTAVASARAADDRGAQARAARDLRYWTARYANAEVVPPPQNADTVTFGAQATLEYNDGRRRIFRIVGQDEADPEQGLLSYAAPLARALLGRCVGDVVRAGAGTAEIIAITITPDLAEPATEGP